MARTQAAAIAIAGLLAVVTVRAACPLDVVDVFGVVVAASDGTALAGASLDAGWDERAAGRMAINREAGADGAFALRIAFDTYSGRTLAGRDVCAARLAQLDLRVEHAGFRPLQLTLPRAELRQPLRLELQPAN
jgi:hypothetical protein